MADQSGLREFVAVVKHGSFTAAADSLNVSTAFCGESSTTANRKTIAGRRFEDERGIRAGLTRQRPRREQQVPLGVQIVTRLLGTFEPAKVRDDEGQGASARAISLTCRRSEPQQPPKTFNHGILPLICRY